MATIDDLTIQIKADASSAAREIDNLTGSLQRLGNVSIDDSVKRVASNLRTLKNAISGLSQLNINNTSKQLRALASGLNALGNVKNVDLNNYSRQLHNLSKSLNELQPIANGSFNLRQLTGDIYESFSLLSTLGKTNLGSYVSQLKNVKEQLEGFSQSAIDFSQFREQMQGLSDALQPLSEIAKAGGLNSCVNALKKLNETMGKLSPQNLNQFASGIKNLVKALEPLIAIDGQLKNVATTLSSIGSINSSALGKLTGTLNKSSSTVKKVDSSWTQFSKSLTGSIVRARIFTNLIKRMVGSMSSLLSYSTDYTETLNMFNVAMGDCTEEAIQFANSLERTIGIDSGEWMKYQGTLNMLARGMGVSSDKAKLMSQNLTQLAYDYSSLMNVKVEESFGKIQSALSGQAKGLKEYGNDVSATQVALTGLRYGLKGQVSDWTTSTQAAMRYITLMENAQRTGVFNDLARSINTPANSIRLLSAQMTQFKRAVGSIISVVATKLIPIFQVFIGVLTRAAQWLYTLMGFKFDTGIDYGSVDYGVDDAEDLQDATGGASDNLGSAKKNAEKLKKVLMGFDELNIIPAPNESADTGSGGGSGGGLGGLQSLDLSKIDLPTYDFLDGLTNNANKKIDEIEARLKEIFKPVTDAWNVVGGALKNDWFTMVDTVKAKYEAMSASFYSVWQNGTGQKTVETILYIIDDIIVTVALLNQKWTEAWTEADKGTQIIQALWNGINSLIGLVKDLFDSVVRISQNVDMDKLMNSFLNLANTFEKVSERTREVGDVLLKYVLEPLSTFTINEAIPNGLNAIASACDWIVGTNIVDTLGSLVEIIAVLGGVGYIASQFGLLSGMFTSISTTLAPVVTLFNALVEAFSGFTLVESFQFALLGVQTAFTEIIAPVGVVVGVFLTVVESFKKMYKESETFRTAVSKAINYVKEIVNSVWNGTIYPIIKIAMGVLMALWESSIKPLWENIKVFIGTLLQIFLQMWNIIAPILDIAIDIIGGGIVIAFNILADVAGVVIGAIVNLFNIFMVAVNTLLGYVSPIFDTLAGIMSSIFDGFKKAYDSVFKPLVNGLITGFESFANGAITGINAVIKALNKLSFKIPNWVPEFGGKTWGMNLSEIKKVSIPRLAEGGILDTGQLFIANEAGPEMVGSFGNRTGVANNDQIVKGITQGVYDAMMRANSNGGKQNITLTVDGNTLFSIFVDEHNQQVIQTGESPLLI